MCSSEGYNGGNMANIEISPVKKLIEDALVEVARLENDSDMNGFEVLQVSRIREYLESADTAASKL